MKTMDELDSGKFGTLQTNSFNGNALRQNTKLPEDAWDLIDDTIMQVATRRTQAIDRLQNANLINREVDDYALTYNWDVMSDTGDAEQSMSGHTRTDEDMEDFDQDGVPLIVTSKDFRIADRKLNAIQAGRVSVDTHIVSQKARKVIETLEDTIFNGAGITYQGKSAEGLIGFADAVESSGDITGAWDTNSGDIYEDVKIIRDSIKDMHYYGPFTLFVSSDVYSAMDIPDPEGSGDLELLERVAGISAIEEVVEADVLSSGQGVMVQLTPDVIELAQQMDVQTIEWQSGDELVNLYKVMAIMSPAVKSDYNNNTGIAYLDGDLIE